MLAAAPEILTALILGDAFRLGVGIGAGLIRAKSANVMFAAMLPCSTTRITGTCRTRRKRPSLHHFECQHERQKALLKYTYDPSAIDFHR